MYILFQMHITWFETKMALETLKSVQAAIQHTAYPVKIKLCFNAQTYYDTPLEGDAEGMFDILLEDRFVNQAEILWKKDIVHTELHAWSDIYRNMVMYEYGGIYCDFDIIWCKEIDSLLDKIDTFVIAYQGIDGREGCNMGVMIGEKESRFCEQYLQCFQKYGEYEQKNHIGIFSTAVPKQIAESNKDIVHILPHTTFHWPLYHTASIRWLYFSSPDQNDTVVDPLSGLRSSDQLLDNYAHHCFGIHHDGIKEYITEDFILTQDTSFTRKTRPLVLWKR